MIVKYLVSVLSTFLMMAVGYEVESMTSVNQSVIEEYVKKFPWIMVITTSVLAPLYEEVLLADSNTKVVNDWLDETKSFLVNLIPANSNLSKKLLIISFKELKLKE